MIDTNDKTTQALDLGEQPKRRGRPVTGKAVSNAERQRAYRERKSNAIYNQTQDLYADLEEAKERIKQLEKLLKHKEGVIRMLVGEEAKDRESKGKQRAKPQA